MENNLLNFLIAGGLAVAIALGGASLVVAVNSTSTNTEPVVANESTMKKPGILGLYGGFFKLLGIKRLLTAQEILGIKVGKNEDENNKKEIIVTTDIKELEILDLSKTMGNLEWILKQLKYPNHYTDMISMETLHKVKYIQLAIFAIAQKHKTQFDDKGTGIFGIEVAVHHKAGIAKQTNKQTNTPAKAESWNFVFKLLTRRTNKLWTAGTFATNMPKIPNSEVFKTVLNEEAILDANLQILLWKKSGSAKPDGTDFDIAIMLNKKTGKVFILAKTRIIIYSQGVIAIDATITL